MSDETEALGWRDHAIAVVDPKSGLWRLVVAPVIAAVHFTVVYISTSVPCVAGSGSSLHQVRLAMAAVTLLALVAIGFCAWTAWRRLRLVRRSRRGPAKARNELEFLSRITLYLANLSWVGVLFVASPLAFFGSCT